MPATTADITQEMIADFAEKVAAVAEAEAPAETLEEFAEHLADAAWETEQAEVQTAAVLTRAADLLAEALETEDPTERAALLRRADRRLRAGGWDALDEYLDMVRLD